MVGPKWKMCFQSAAVNREIVIFLTSAKDSVLTYEKTKTAFKKFLLGQHGKISKAEHKNRKLTGTSEAAQEVTAVQVTDVLQKAGLLKNSAVRSVHRLFESKTAEDSEGSSSESSGTDQRRTDKLEDEWPQSAQGVELDAPVPTLASQPVEPETRRPTRDELPFFSHNNAVHIMRIKDIDGLAKETFSDSGHEKLDQIYASICNPKHGVPVAARGVDGGSGQVCSQGPVPCKVSEGQET
ncbi:hypothetical protein WJX77_005780 [Trebouxia sp. C0004]